MPPRIPHKFIKDVECKHCAICDLYLPLAEFSKQKGSADGFVYACRKCINQKNQQPEIREKRLEYKHKYYKENSKEIMQKYKDYVKNNEEEIRRRRSEQYYADHDKSKAKLRKAYWNNREKRLKKQREWKKVNKEKVNLSIAKRTAKQKELPNTLTLKEWEECKSYFSNTCCYCGKKSERLEKEHFIPLFKNGELTKFNILPACRACNLSKHDRDFFEWYPKQPFYSQERQDKILKYLNK